MGAYILRRLLLMLPTLLGITLLVFALMALAPGGLTPAQLSQGGQLDPEAKKLILEYYQQRYGLDQPWYWQYLRWLNNLSPIGFAQDTVGQWQFVGLKAVDLGESFRYGRSVWALIAERVPITLLLNLLSLPLVYGLAIVLGVQAAQQRGSGFDQGSNLLLLGLWSVPNMLAGVLLIGFFTNVQHWRWFPSAGMGGAEGWTFLPQWPSATAAFWGLMMVLLGCVSALALAHASRLWRGAALSLLWALALWQIFVSSGSLTPPHTGAEWALWLLLWALGGAALSLLAPRALAFLIYAPLCILVLTSLLPEVFAPHHAGWLLERLWHLLLPVLCLSYAGVAFLAKLTRGSVLSNMRADYVRTAWVKGLNAEQVLWRHVFRNSLLPLITVSASLLPALLAGSVVVETLFSIEGMGKLAVEAVKGRDKELVLGITLLSAWLTLVGYLLADLCYAWADPRVRYDAA